MSILKKKNNNLSSYRDVFDKQLQHNNLRSRCIVRSYSINDVTYWYIYSYRKRLGVAGGVRWDG